MTDPGRWRRRSIRLRGFDYSQFGVYFVTICAQDRICFFGGFNENDVVLSEPGAMVWDIWDELAERYVGVATDALVVMPNHVHGIIVLAPGREEEGQPQGVAPTGLSLPNVVHRFKSLTTARYRHGVLEQGWMPFPGRLWQRNYYERVVRSETELFQLREYIATNPQRWMQDEENPTIQPPLIRRGNPPWLPE